MRKNSFEKSNQNILHFCSGARAFNCCFVGDVRIPLCGNSYVCRMGGSYYDGDNDDDGDSFHDGSGDGGVAESDVDACI